MDKQSVKQLDNHTDSHAKSHTDRETLYRLIRTKIDVIE